MALDTKVGDGVSHEDAGTEISRLFERYREIARQAELAHEQVEVDLVPLAQQRPVAPARRFERS